MLITRALVAGAAAAFTFAAPAHADPTPAPGPGYQIPGPQFPGAQTYSPHCLSYMVSCGFEFNPDRMTWDTRSDDDD